MTREQFIERMEEITLSSNVGDTYFKVYGEKWGEDDWYGHYTFQNIKDKFEKGFNLHLSYQKVYSRVILMYLYIERNSVKLIQGKTIESFIQDEERNLPLECWKKMLRVIFQEKEIVRRIIGGKITYCGRMIRPIVYRKSILSIHLMEYNNIKNVIERVINDNPDLFSKEVRFNTETNILYLGVAHQCFEEYENYSCHILEGMEKFYWTNGKGYYWCSKTG